MAFSVQLTRAGQVPYTNGTFQGFRFTVTAHDAVNVDNEIFRLYQQPLDPLQQTRTPVFDGICTPADLIDLPINAPVPPNYRYRVAAIDVTYENPTIGAEQWQSIQDDIDILLKSLEASSHLTDTEIITISEP